MTAALAACVKWSILIRITTSNQLICAQQENCSWVVVKCLSGSMVQPTDQNKDSSEDDENNELLSREVSLLAAINTSLLMKQLVCSKAISDNHLVALDNLDGALISSTRPLPHRPIPRPFLKNKLAFL